MSTYRELIQRAKSGDINAISQLYERASQHDGMAMSCLGWMFTHGIGLEKNAEQGLEWFRKAAEADESAACFHLAEIHNHGTGVKKNLGQAIHWYQKAVDLGMEQAKFPLASLYLKAPEGLRNVRQGVSLLRELASTGTTDAHYLLALLYDPFESDYTGVPLSALIAMNWYQKPAEDGNASAQYRLGRLMKNTTAQSAQGDAWIKKAAENGSAEATNALAGV